jgi:hypothetical protein
MNSTNPPTTIEHDEGLLRNVLFNNTLSKDVALASVSMGHFSLCTICRKSLSYRRKLWL